MITRYLTMFAALVFTAVSVSAQNLEIVHHDSIAYGNSWYTPDVAAHMTLQNNSSATMTLKISRIDKNGYNSLTDSNAICVGNLCYPTTTSTTIMAFDVLAGAQSSDFSGHVYPELDGSTMSGPIEYVVFNTVAPFDSASFVVWYSVGPTVGINEEAKANISAYPNPAKDFFDIDLGASMDEGRVLIYDVVGNLVKVVSINKGDSVVRVNTSEVKNGMYLYVIEQNGTAIISKKISVAK